MQIPDHYRFPIERLTRNHQWPRVSALDIAENTWRGPQGFPSRTLDNQRLAERERQSQEYTRTVKYQLRPLLDRLIP